ncbi:MAG: alpha/beta hydrolase [Flavobacteriales bacterium]|nr:alpha/beta hydrolase [Flavobacteriales bacterium]
MEALSYHKNDDVYIHYDRLAEEYGYTPYHRYFQHTSIQSAQHTIHLDVFEYSKKAPTIIMIPGTAMYSMCYSEIMYKLGKEGYNFVGIDPRGHGRSTGLRGDYTIQEIMEDVQAAITFAADRFNSKVSLLGSSQGGIVALYLAAKDHRIQSVMCQNFADLTDYQNTNFLKYPTIAKTLRPILLNMSSRIFSDTQFPVDMYLDLQKIQLKFFGNAYNFLKQDPLALRSISLRALSSLSYTKLDRPISEIEVPVLVFQGDADTIFPVDYTKHIYSKLNCKKRFEVFSGMNHGIITNNVPDIIPSLKEWLKEIY